MPSARDIVEQYFRAHYAGDTDIARQYLADNLSFRGPAASFASADEYLRASEHAVRAVKHVQMHKVFVDDSDVAVFYDLHIDHQVGFITIVDWYHLEGDKIATIHTIFDTGPFTSSIGQTAVDPVCGMAIGKASAAATRTFAAETYYFCNLGCAERFESQPEQYILPSRNTPDPASA
jgi:YHS domain-containing protein